MKLHPTKSCLRCCEPTLERSGQFYRCRTCGFLEEETQSLSESIDSYQDRIERTLDLVEIFSLGRRAYEKRDRKQVREELTKIKNQFKGDHIKW
jgi:FtsZ-binding cell division protein ZapB